MIIIVHLYCYCHIELKMLPQRCFHSLTITGQCQPAVREGRQDRPRVRYRILWPLILCRNDFFSINGRCYSIVKSDIIVTLKKISTKIHTDIPLILMISKFITLSIRVVRFVLGFVGIAIGCTHRDNTKMNYWPTRCPRYRGQTWPMLCCCWSPWASKICYSSTLWTRLLR